MPQRLPAEHADDIRAAAAKYRLDPALVAAIIYEESHFRTACRSHQRRRRAHAGPARQPPRDRAQDGRAEQASSSADLSDPRVNILYGSYYLRYLLDHYDGVEMIARGGLQRAVSRQRRRWVTRASAAGKLHALQDIPFTETRDYVRRVLEQSAEDLPCAAYERQLGPARG